MTKTQKDWINAMSNQNNDEKEDDNQEEKLRFAESRARIDKIH